MAFRELEVQGLGRAAGRRWPPFLREMAALDTFPDRVVSLYLDVCWSDEQQPERTRLAIKDQLRRLRAGVGEDEAAAAITRDLDHVEALVEDRIHRDGAPSERGDAAFLCSARAFERGLRSVHRFPNVVEVRPMPVLRPLIASLPTSGRVLCALTDSTTTRLYLLASDGAGALDTVEGLVPRRHHAGGWAQLKLQHWRIEEVAHHHRDAAAAIARLIDTEERWRVLVAGRPEYLGDLIAHLPEPVKARTRTVPGIDPTDSEPQALAAFARGLAAIERVEGLARVRAAEDAAGAGLRGALGVSDVIGAANTGRLAELLLADNFCRDGWRCARCRVIGDGSAAETCSACGGPTEAVELGEALVHGAVLQDAGVTHVVAPSRLDLHRGVAALLRY